MKKALKFLLLFVFGIGVLFLLGPRPDTDDTITFEAVAIGENIEAYLREKESTVPSLNPGAAKEIIWADPTSKSQTDIAIVYAHGFSATNQEIRPVPDYVANALDANLYYMRFDGHGQNGEAMGNATTTAWANDFAEAMEIGKRLGKRVLIISTSTGSTLTTWAMSKPELSKKVIGIVMVSPNFELQGLSTSLANIPWAETILPAVAGSERSWEPINEEHGKWWTTAYPSKAVFPMMSYLRLLKDIDKSTIKIPALFIYSPEDKVIIPTEVEKVASEWGGPVELMKLNTTTDPFHHVIAGDILSPANTDKASSAIIEWSQGLN